MRTTGPDPAAPRYRTTLVDKKRLDSRRVKRHYKFTLPRPISAFLVHRGVFAKKRARRERARRHVWVDIQHDRDFKVIDGAYDWREGTAVSAADEAGAAIFRAGAARRGRVPRAGEQNPYGTLSLTNNTAAGVYAPHAELVDPSTGLPDTESGTMNVPTYAVPLAVGGDAVQCFDQGTNGSNPAGFANYNSAGVPQPYEPGTVSAAQVQSDTTTLPNTTGTTVTQGLAADYSLAWAGNQQTADTAGYVSGTVKLSLQVVKGVAGGFVSPGAVVTGILGIFEYFLENSCKESGNYFNITAAETRGAASSATINASTEVWDYYPGSGSSPPGLQMNPSAKNQGGSHLWLDPYGAILTGLRDNICDCPSVGNNVIELNWNSANPCITTPAVQCSLDPPGSPTVTNPASAGSAEIDCGQENLKCPFPAAGFPPNPKISPIWAGLSGGSTGVLWKCNPLDSYDCDSLDTAGDHDLTAMEWGGGSIYVGLSNAVLWQCSPTQANECTTLDTIGDHNGITAIAYGDGNVYVGVYTGSGVNEGLLFECNATEENSCTQIDSAGDGTQISDLLFENGTLYAARSDGLIWSCNPNQANSCAALDNAGNNSINALAWGPGPGGSDTLFAGISNGIMWSCDPTLVADCQTFNTAPQSIEVLEYSGDQLYAGIAYDSDTNSGGLIWQCPSDTANACASITTDYNPTALVLANSSLYSGDASGNIYKCPVELNATCQQLAYGAEGQYISGLVARPAS